MWWHAHVVAIRNTVLGGLIVTPRSYDVPGRKAPPMGEENVVGEHVSLHDSTVLSTSPFVALLHGLLATITLVSILPFQGHLQPPTCSATMFSFPMGEENVVGEHVRLHYCSVNITR